MIRCVWIVLYGIFIIDNNRILFVKRKDYTDNGVGPQKNTICQSQWVLLNFYSATGAKLWKLTCKFAFLTGLGTHLVKQDRIPSAKYSSGFSHLVLWTKDFAFFSFNRSAEKSVRVTAMEGFYRDRGMNPSFHLQQKICEIFLLHFLLHQM